jgi:hypothetical protein
MALTAIHPGEHLAEELGAPEMSTATLAGQIRAPANRIPGISRCLAKLALIIRRKLLPDVVAYSAEHRHDFLVRPSVARTA